VSSTDRAFRIAAVGDNCVDVLRPAGHRLIGGNAVNVAVQVARLGGRSAYFGAVGDDADGALTTRALAGNGVDIGHVVRRPLPTAHTLIDISANGERHFVFEDFGACAGYTPDAAAVAALLEYDHVHIGWLDDGGALRRRLSATGRSVSQDVTVNASPENLGVEGLSIAFASLEGSHGDAAVLARDLLARGARNVVVTRGSSGSSVFVGGIDASIPASPVEPVDTTGAGDSYIAGFLLAHLAGASPEVAGTRAAAHAARTCLHVGGFPQDAAG
jgi:fructoselysine 6-kinase